MTRIEELKQTIKEIKGADELNKEDFLKFFDKYYRYCGSDNGLYVSLDKYDTGVNFEIWFTNLDIYEAFKNSENYEFIKEEFDEDLIEEYEQVLDEADGNLMRNNSYYLNLVGDKERINEIVLDYYFENEEEFDSDTIWNARDYIVEETIDQLNQLIEDEEN